MEDSISQGITAANPYFCNICLRGFSESAELEAHAREHEAEEAMNNYSNTPNVNTTNVSQESIKLALPTGIVNPSLVNAIVASNTSDQNIVTSCVDPNVVAPILIVNNVVNSEVVTPTSPYTCNVCQRGFSQRSHLETHSRIHSGERPFECNQCGAAFSRRGNLVRHRLSHGGERKHKCNVCGRKFSQKSHLQVHTRVHTGERPYKCDRCGYAFSRNGNLVRHKRANKGGKRKYSCIAPSLLEQQEQDLGVAQPQQVALVPVTQPQGEVQVQVQPQLIGIAEVQAGVGDSVAKTANPKEVNPQEEPETNKNDQTPVVATATNIVQLGSVPYQIMATMPSQLATVQPITSLQQIPNVPHQLVTVPQHISIHHLTGIHNLASVPLHIDIPTT